jgi:hypothetical protein
MRRGKTIVRIMEAVRRGRLREPFSPSAVNNALDIDFAGVFLPKHRLGKPGKNTPLFLRVSQHPALYRLNVDWLSRVH